MPTLDPDAYRIHPGQRRFHLRRCDPSDDGGFAKEDAQAALVPLQEEFARLAENLYAEHARALLVVLQGMDASGKDSAVRRVFSPLDPASCHAHSFKAPAGEETAHDFLWRIHQRVPRAGHVGVFNRSHYEDAVIARIHLLAPEEKLAHRLRHIVDFEDMLATEGTAVVKFFLHIGKAHQKDRLEKRLKDPAKRWKFDPTDLREREFWDAYQDTYSEALRATSSKAAPWFVVPAENRAFRDLLMTRILVDRLARMAPRPRPPRMPYGKILRKLRAGD